MKRIIRVFPNRTSYTPTDDMVYIGMPDMLIPDHDEVHISCTFTWDRPRCRELLYHWQGATDKPVKLGGVAFESEVKGFEQGLYIKDNITFTSRGCNNNCKFCMVPRIEGKLVELPIIKGNVIQDNNFLQCSKEHKEKTFQMLKSQRGICFKGGLETRYIEDHFIECLVNLGTKKVKELWLACDDDKAIDRLRMAVEKLQAVGFNRNKIYCYALIGDDMGRNEDRLQEIFRIGAMPRAQLYQDFEDTKKVYSKDWQRFARQWQRPACIKAHCIKGTQYTDEF